MSRDSLWYESKQKFSPCSLRSIRKVLQAKSGRCFSEPEESFCGNLRVEGDEQCDAGLLGTEDNDACCDKNCKLRRNQGAVCSDKNSPCCQHCQYMPSGVKCREAQYATCEQEARCSGGHADCPKSPPMADGTICQERGQCRNGKCVPYCETQGLQSCMCDIIQDACKRCCRMSINETCFPVEPPDMLPDGTPCIQGFCNKVSALDFDRKNESKNVLSFLAGTVRENHSRCRRTILGHHRRNQHQQSVTFPSRQHRQ